MTLAKIRLWKQSEGLANLGNIVAETLFSDMFPQGG